MNIETGQDPSSILGKSGTYTGDANSLFGQALMAQLGKGFQSDCEKTFSGEFNGSAIGIHSASSKFDIAAAPAMHARLDVAAP